MLTCEGMMQEGTIELTEGHITDITPVGNAPEKSVFSTSQVCNCTYVTSLKDCFMQLTFSYLCPPFVRLTFSS